VVSSFIVASASLRQPGARLLPVWFRLVRLRYVKYGREETSRELDLLYFWKGELLYVRVTTNGGGQRGGHGWRAYSDLRLGSPDEIHRIKGVQLPERLQMARDEILAKLKEALNEYKDLGVLSSLTSIEATFDF
jgi:hypothetical protein